MSRRNISKKRFPEADPIYNSYLVSLLIARILKSGKKNLAQKIVHEAFEIIKSRTNQDPLEVFEKAVKNASPLVEVKARRVGGSTYQVPIEVNRFRQPIFMWIIQIRLNESGRTHAIEISYELLMHQW